jgi:hypothetical protein
MSIEKSKEELKEKLIDEDTGVNWEYLLRLKKQDIESRTENYHQGMFLLKDLGIVTTKSARNYFILEPVMMTHAGPKLSAVGYPAYFHKKEDAEEFRKTFFPNGLIARIEE